MNIDREQQWQAYLDGELSACEAAEFEASLTEAERAHLAAEAKFERSLADHLREGVGCPDEVWARTRARLGAKPRGRNGVTTRRRWALTAAALATVVLAAVMLPSLYPMGFTGLLDGGVVLAADSVEQLTAQSETKPDWNSVEDYLHAKGINLDLAAQAVIKRAMPAHRSIDLIGARQERFAGTRVTEVLVNCCGKPVKVILAPRDSPAARAVMTASKGENDILATQPVGSYTVAVVARHPAAGLVYMVSAAGR